MPQVFETLTEAGESFGRWIARTGYADATMAMYRSKVARFLAFAEAGGAEYAEVLTDEHVRDYAVRDFRRALMVEEKAAVATVESYLAALGVFFDYVGLGKPRVKRQQTPRREPRSLDQDALRRALRAAERRGARDYAICQTMFQTGLRVSELVALDTDDVWLGERAGHAESRYGKGGEAKRVALPADTRAALRAWVAVRRELGHPEVGPLFVSRLGRRLSVRRVQSMVAAIAAEAGVDLTPHVFRHTFARSWLDTGGDVGGLQEALGHRNLSSTQVYTRPSSTVLAEQAERVRIDL